MKKVCQLWNNMRERQHLSEKKKWKTTLLEGKKCITIRRYSHGKTSMKSSELDLRNKWEELERWASIKYISLIPRSCVIYTQRTCLHCCTGQNVHYWKSDQLNIQSLSLKCYVKPKSFRVQLMKMHRVIFPKLHSFVVLMSYQRRQHGRLRKFSLNTYISLRGFPWVPH